MIKKIFRKAKNVLVPLKARQKARIKKYKSNGAVPWSTGYHEYKEQQIGNVITDLQIIKGFQSQSIPVGYGIGVDDRIVEYPWIFSNLSNEKKIMLDAGSTFNFDYLLDHPTIKQKDLTIYTYYPESPNFNEKRVSYVYGDLRVLPFRDNYFDEIVCQSTLEHIDMDNSMYGYDLSHVTNKNKSYEYLKVIAEISRVLKPQGTAMITFPYGIFENHGFFQQYDNEMVGRMRNELDANGQTTLTFFKYSKEGWAVSKQENCEDATSYNPHTGLGKGTDGAAHSRCICCIKFIKR